MLGRLLAGQLCDPSSIVGRLVLAPLWNRRNAALNDLALACLHLAPDDRVLEIGFGGGYLLGRMVCVVTQGFLAGVDASEAMVASCTRRFRSLVESETLELRCARAESLPYPPHHFTKLCTVNSLFYWTDPPRALAEMVRVLKPGGAAVICLTCKHSLERKRFAGHGLVLYEDEEVSRMLERAGFASVEANHASDRHRDFVCFVGERQAAGSP